jgi:hypothetical protein
MPLTTARARTAVLETTVPGFTRLFALPVGLVSLSGLLLPRRPG